jgi:hypothetical protein
VAVVTDKQFYLDNALTQISEVFIKRQKGKWDNLLLFDGDEGSGKSTFAIALCYYYAYLTKKKFTTENIFFDLNNLMDFASKNEEQIILWDESALGGLSTQWSSKEQTKLVQALMTARKKRHFWIFIIPKFHELRRYVVRRSVGLVHVYSPDGIERGYFAYYKKDKKNQLFDDVKRKKNEYGYRKYMSFHGKFTRYDNKDIIDWEAYEKKKDEAIIKMFSNDADAVNDKIIRLKYFVTQLKRYNLTELSEELGVPRPTLYDWRKLDKKYPDILGN